MTDRQRIPHHVLLRLVEEFQVFGQVVRLRLIEYLQRGSATPQEIADELGLSQQNVSKHLQVLFKAGVVSRRRDGTSVLYTLADERAGRILEAMVIRASDQITELSRLVSGEEDRDERGDPDKPTPGESGESQEALEPKNGPDSDGAHREPGDGQDPEVNDAQ